MRHEHNKSFKIISLFFLLICSLLLSLLLCELALRILVHTGQNIDLGDIVRDERSLLYRYDPLLGWFPQESSKIYIRHNAMGFRDIDHSDKKEKKRIIFLGDSFVWGYDCPCYIITADTCLCVKKDIDPVCYNIPLKGRFVEQLRPLLPGFELFNMGVSGYGTDQEFLLLKKFTPIVQPDAVVLLYEEGDDTYENVNNLVYGGYYKPYFEMENGALVLKGVPVPRSLTYLLKANILFRHSYLFRFLFQKYQQLNVKYEQTQPAESPTRLIITEMYSYLKKRQISFLIGFIEKDDAMWDFCRDLGVPCVDLIFNDRGTELRFQDHGYHWTEKGHSEAAKRILEKLYEYKMIDTSAENVGTESYFSELPR